MSAAVSGRESGAPLVVLVCGGRDFADPLFVWQQLDRLHRRTGIRRVVSGGATGVDAFAARWAREQRVPLGVYPADWRTYGRGAGPRRNQQMLDAEAPDLVLAFPGGRGTADMVRRAKAARVWVTIYGGAP